MDGPHAQLGRAEERPCPRRARRSGGDACRRDVGEAHRGLATASAPAHPARRLMLEICTTDADGVPLVMLRGAATGELLERIALGIGALASGARAVFVDIERLEPADAAALAALFRSLDRTCSRWSVVPA